MKKIILIKDEQKQEFKSWKQALEANNDFTPKNANAAKRTLEKMGYVVEYDGELTQPTRTPKNPHTLIERLISQLPSNEEEIKKLVNEKYALYDSMKIGSNVEPILKKVEKVDEKINNLKNADKEEALVELVKKLYNDYKNKPEETKPEETKPEEGKA